MKRKFLILASAILAGCSNTPSSGNVEKAMEAAVASCENVEVFDVKKTNGFQDDGFYRVEFTYGVRLKDAGQLKKMKELWNEEKRRAAEYIPAHAEYQQKVEALKKEIAAISTASYQSSFPATVGRQLSQSEEAAEKIALAEYHAKESAAREPKEQELAALEAAWKNSRAEVPRERIFGNVYDVMFSLYMAGCSSEAWKYVGGAMTEHWNLAKRANPPNVKEREMDVSLFLEVQEVGMNGVMPMRKTEQGWQKI